MVVHCSCAGRWHSNFLIPGTPQGQSFSDFLLESAIMGVILGKPVRLFEACFPSLLLGKFWWGLGDEVRGMSFKLKSMGSHLIVTLICFLQGRKIVDTDYGLIERKAVFQGTSWLNKFFSESSESSPLWTQGPCWNLESIKPSKGSSVDPASGSTPSDLLESFLRDVRMLFKYF